MREIRTPGSVGGRRGNPALYPTILITLCYSAPVPRYARLDIAEVLRPAVGQGRARPRVLAADPNGPRRRPGLRPAHVGEGERWRRRGRKFWTQRAKSGNVPCYAAVPHYAA